MKKRLPIKAVLCFGLLLVTGVSLVTAGEPEIQTSDRNNQYQAPFRYVIAHNSISGRRNEQTRQVEILMDENAFSETKLKELFKLVSRRFRKPKQLDVQVFTSLQDIETPEEREAPGMSERSDIRNTEVHPLAFFIRDEHGNEWFSYNHEKGSPALRTVVIKGRIPAAQ